jgi:aspartyl protease family protein
VTNDTMLGGLYLVMALMLVFAGVMSRREPIAKMAVMALAWIAIFGAGFVLFAFRDNFSYLAQRLKSEATGSPMVEGGELRIPQAIDGHFWIDAEVNGKPVKFLVDSGATMTTIGRKTATELGLDVSGRRNQVVQTANGMVRVASTRADELSIGPIVRNDVGVHIADNEDMNVLGMNYLSSLRSWGVEGRWLILRS